MSGSSTFSNYWPFSCSVFDVAVTFPLICGFLISFLRAEIPKTTSYGILAILLWMIMFFFTSGFSKNTIFDFLPFRIKSHLLQTIFAFVALETQSVFILLQINWAHFNFFIKFHQRPFNCVDELKKFQVSLHVIYACAKWELSWRLGNSLNSLVEKTSSRFQLLIRSIT